MLKPEDGYNEFDSTDESSEECTWFSCCDGPTLHPLSVVGVLQVLLHSKSTEDGIWMVSVLFLYISVYLYVPLFSEFCEW